MLNSVALLPAHNCINVALEISPALVVLHVEAKVVLRAGIAGDGSGGDAL